MMHSRIPAPFALSASALLLSVVLSALAASSSAFQDTARGKQLFEKRCTGCHSLDRNKEGPRLGGVYGRTAGTAPDFHYSDALRNAHFTWDEQRLDQWLTDTQALVDDNNMDFHVPNAEERSEIIRYLKMLSTPQSASR